MTPLQIKEVPLRTPEEIKAMTECGMSVMMDRLPGEPPDEAADDSACAEAPQVSPRTMRVSHVDYHAG